MVKPDTGSCSINGSPRSVDLSIFTILFVKIGHIPDNYQATDVKWQAMLQQQLFGKKQA